MLSRGDDRLAAWVGRQARILVAAGVLLVILALNPSLDFTVQQYLFDPTTGAFPLRRLRWFEAVFHAGLKHASLAAAVMTWALCIIAWRGKIRWLAPRSALVLALGLILVPVVTGALKQLTNKHCPWELIQFGGHYPYVALFDVGARDLPRGACWPAGHASGGFAWLALGPALSGFSAHAARNAIVVALVAGFVMGMSRVLQGAHFVSHVLWSAWIAWTTVVALTVVVRPKLGVS